MTDRATIVIPNWNGKHFLGPCLTSLRRQEFEDFETIVVDNGSTDDSVEFIVENFPEVRAIPLERNQGFSVAVNVGIRSSDTEFVVLLNNDTEQDQGWLEALVRDADAYREAGSFASKLLDHKEREVLDGAGDALRRSGLPYRLGHGERDRGQLDKPSYVFGACAAAALYRNDMLDQIGLFDEDFFAYCEDGDLSFRAQLAGYRCRYVPDAVVYHIGSASTGGKRSPMATRLGTRNGLSLLVKNLPIALVPRFLPFVLLGQIFRLLMTVVSRVWRAHLDGLAEAVRLLPLMLKKRKEIQRHRKVSTKYVRRLLRESSRSANMSLLRRLQDGARRKLSL